MPETAMATATTIREATAVDVEAVVSMGMYFLGTVYAGRIVPNEESLRRLAGLLIAQDESVIFVAERDGVVLGMIGVWIFLHPMSGEFTATEVMWWVQPDARGIGMRLLYAAKRWAVEHGQSTMQLIAPTPDVERLYERLECEPIERVYRWGLV